MQFHGLLRGRERCQMPAEVLLNGLQGSMLFWLQRTFFSEFEDSESYDKNND